MTLSMTLAVAIGGLMGAPSRYLLDRAISRGLDNDRPWGTFFINASGSLLLGLLTGLMLAHHLSSWPKALVGTGFCGAFTTFSTFSFETFILAEERRYSEALVNVVGSVVVGLALAAAGLAVGLSV